MTTVWMVVDVTVGDSDHTNRSIATISNGRVG
jgi:hypothetical protein